MRANPFVCANLVPIAATLAYTLADGWLLPAAVHADPPGPAKNWTRTFGDEFNGSTLASDKWSAVWPWGNGENNTYPDCYFAPQNVSLSKGSLRLKGDNESAKGKKFTAAVVTTKDKFAQQFGYFEIRCRIPKGKGIWPAFWLLAQNSAVPEGSKGWYEIDVFEVLGHDTKTVHMNNIFPGKEKQDSKQVSYTGVDVSDGLHTFGLLWEKGRTRMYIDGVQRYENVGDGVPAQPMYLLINTAVGGAWPSSWKQEPDATTPYPNYLDVDYVRVWKRTVPVKKTNQTARVRRLPGDRGSMGRFPFGGR